MPRIAAFALLAVFATSCTPGDGLRDVLDRMVEAYGGERALRRADRMVQEWELVALSGGERGMDRRSIDVPGRLKVELTYPQRREVRLLNGEAGYFASSGYGVRAAATPQRDAMRLQMMRLYSPLALRERMGAIEVVRNDNHWVLSLTEFGLRTDYFVEHESLHIVKVVGVLSIGGGEMTFAAEYSDFSVIDGVLFHRRENKFVGNRNTAVLQLRKVEFDVEFDAADFEPDNESQGENVTIAGI